MHTSHLPAAPREVPPSLPAAPPTRSPWGWATLLFLAGWAAGFVNAAFPILTWPVAAASIAAMLLIAWLVVRYELPRRPATGDRPGDGAVRGAPLRESLN